MTCNTLGGLLRWPLMFVLALVMPAGAKITPWPLDRFVTESILIVLARVETIEPTGLRVREYDELKVRISIENVLKGHAGSQGAFFTLRSAPEFPRFEVGQRCLLFISHYDGKLWVTQGANGKLLLDANQVRDVQMIGEPETQSLATFLKKSSKPLVVT